MPEKAASSAEFLTKIKEDKRLLEEFCASERLAALRDRLKDPNLNLDELRQFLPPSTFGLILSLETPGGHARLSQRLAPDGGEILDKVRELVNLHLPTLRDHPVAWRVLAASLGRGWESREVDPIEKSMNRIVEIGRFVCWMGKPPNLEPIVRLGFIGSGKELLLDSTLDVDDVLFLAGVFSGIAVNMLEESRPLRLAGNLELGVENRKRMASHLAKLRETLEKLLDLAPAYAIDVPAGTVSKASPSS